ncbi:hypothetical protein M434DRAFT_31918 [Hypoxylon sp. CO27-5]|nr:hypothetical protein M434DRAFT_31918 [Hypoxylon sp. CO27-5]
MSAPQNLAEHVRKEQPQMFLSLAPTTSASYPTAQSIKPALGARRSSSQSSGSSSGSLRFLKLGPVHWGEHPGEHKEDYHEVAVEDPHRIPTSEFAICYRDVRAKRKAVKIYLHILQLCGIYTKLSEVTAA